MNIPDIVLGACNALLVLALLASLTRERVHITGPITALALYVMACAFAAMGSWPSVGPVVLMAVLWTIIGGRALAKHFKQPKGGPWAL